MRYVVTIAIPCDEDSKDKMCGQFSEYGFRMSYYEGVAMFISDERLLDDVMNALELAATFPGHSIRLKRK